MSFLGRCTRTLVMSLALAVPLAAQAGSGRLVGTVLDTQGRPLAGAVVEIVDSDRKQVTALDGRYALDGLPAGAFRLRVRMIGYQPKVVTGLRMPGEGGVVRQDVTLMPEAVLLQEVEVTAEAERGALALALDEQRNANVILNAISAEQIARSTDGDAGQVMARVTGVTVQDGRYVVVRGLGERYSVASLNGTRLPSAEPERKVVPLDLFPSSLLAGIVTAKTFTPDQPGDFSGGAVDLRTRDFPAGRRVTLSLGVGANDAALGGDVVRGPRLGQDWLGFAGSARRLPPLAAAAGDLRGLTDAEVNAVIGSFRNVWTPTTAGGTANTSFSASAGGETPVGRLPVGYVASLTYSSAQEVRADEQRALTLPDGSGVRPFNESVGSSGRQTVLWGGLLNLTGRVSPQTKVSLRNSYTRSGDNEAVELVGRNEEFATDLLVNRLGFVERTVQAHQLAAEHLLADRHGLELNLGLSRVTRNEPDRADLVYTTRTDPATGLPVRDAWFGATRSATRTFSTLDETGWDGSANLRLAQSERTRNALKVGAAVRHTDRTADSRAYDIFNRGLGEDERRQAAERIFDGAYAESGRLTLFVNPNGGRYAAEDRVVAGYAMAELWLGGVQVLAGARVEASRLRVDSRTPQGAAVLARLDNTDVLPAISVNVPLSEAHNLRFAASQTLARPEYREVSPVSWFEPLGGTITRGNPELRRTLIRNVDARWEWFPSAGEVVSVGLFAKRFVDPIEKTYVGTTGAANLSFINAASAWNYGVELEARRNLGALAAPLAPVTLFANTTLMQSEITPGNEGISALTNAQRPMVGQSEYVVNGGLSLDLPSGVGGTVLYNVVGPRIVEAGTQPLPDAYEQARQTLDATVQIPLGGRLTLRLDGKNLLDSRVEVRQGEVTRLRYRQGRQVSVGLRLVTGAL